MAKDKTTSRFWLRSDRLNQDYTAPVHLIYQIKGQRKYYSVPDVKMLKVNWDPADQKAVYIDKKKAKAKIEEKDTDLTLLLTSNEVTEINNTLAELLNDIDKIEKRFKLDHVPFSPAMVIEKLNEIKKPGTKKDEPGKNITDFIERFKKERAATHTPGTLKVYNTLKQHIEAFEKQKKTKLAFETLDHSTLRLFQSYLTEEVTKQNAAGETITAPRMNNITAAKQLSTLKTVINYARVIHKINVKEDYRDFKVERKDQEFEVITLTYDEFMAIYNFDLSENKRLDAVRDVFCFSCATGLRYSDLVQLRREHIRRDNTIRMTAAKTDQKLTIPLNPISYAILQKYKEMHAPLPIISNQKTNDYIKEIGALAGITTPIEIMRKYGVKKISTVYPKHQLLSIHVGRKTFVTLSLEKGMSTQDVMSLSGHTTHRSFKRYIDITEERKKLSMEKGWGAVKEANPLTVKSKAS